MSRHLCRMRMLLNCVGYRGQSGKFLCFCCPSYGGIMFLTCLTVCACMHSYMCSQAEAFSDLLLTFSCLTTCQLIVPTWLHCWCCCRLEHWKRGWKMINTSNSILMMWPQLLTVLIQTPTVLQTKARQSCRREVVRIAFIVTVWLYVSLWHIYRQTK